MIKRVAKKFVITIKIAELFPVGNIRENNCGNGIFLVVLASVLNILATCDHIIIFLHRKLGLLFERIVAECCSIIFR